ncbi:cytochrome b5 domain-containing protein [Heliorestis convoluta]|uniref:Putative cytochrome b5 n=1 Tax=Heliorestis convoluta TaxID=356322 RepID=A0A5Q2N2I9_9FIRM|nr:cytochrome b5 domain-containing protein [Heliorestis convoluta]QGG49037.1 putative cytochrome b5 [Heliorestis convoluta]
MLKKIWKRIRKKYVRQKNPLPVKEQTFTAEALKQYDGREGRPAYIAIDGIVYDVTKEPTWEAATHFQLLAGQNLTEPFQRCHRGRQDILERLPRVGLLV